MERHWGEKSPKKTSVNSSGKSEKHISVHENKIYYYSSVNRDSAVELNKKIGELESKGKLTDEIKILLEGILK